MVLARDSGNKQHIHSGVCRGRSKGCSESCWSVWKNHKGWCSNKKKEGLPNPGEQRLWKEASPSRGTQSSLSQPYRGSRWRTWLERIAFRGRGGHRERWRRPGMQSEGIQHGQPGFNSSTTSSLIHMYTVSLMEKWDGFKNGRDLADAEEIKKRWKKYTGRTG